MYHSTMESWAVVGAKKPKVPAPLTEKQKEEIIGLIIKEVNHNYFYTKESNSNALRRDGEFTAEQVFEAFKDDPFWHVTYNDYGYVVFMQKDIHIQRKKDREFTMMKFIHYVLKHRWKLSRHEASIVFYGGFARSAMMAQIAYEENLAAFTAGCKARGVSKGVLNEMIQRRYKGRFDNLEWFQDKVRDLDMLVTYRKVKTGKAFRRYTPDEIEFENDVYRIRSTLDELCRRTPDCVHRYEPDDEPCMCVRDRSIDRNCQRRGITSYREGDYFNYLVTFTSPAYKGKHFDHWGIAIELDITTMVEDKNLDADVNNLVFYYDFNAKDFKFAVRKPYTDSSGPLTVEKIKQNIKKRQFRMFNPDYKKYENWSKFKRAYSRMRVRWENLVYYGFKPDPKYPNLLDRNKYSKYYDKAKKYFDDKVFKETGQKVSHY